MSDRNSALKSVLAGLMALCLFLTAFGWPMEVRGEALTSAPLSRQSGASNGMVRVYLSSLGAPSQVDVTIAGSYSLDGSSATALANGSRVTVRINESTGELTLTKNGATTSMGTDFRLRRHEKSGDNGVKIAQSRQSNNLYPGDVQFKAVRSGGVYRLYTIVHVYIEDYLYGVLPYEMGNSSALEALKAQCVSARTYTVRAMQGGASRSYDLVDTTNDQVYNGTPAGNERCRQAVDETRGIVAMNGNDFTATYYTASNGGQIESVRNIWNSSGYDYIKVKDDPYDYQNPASVVRSFKVVATGAQSNAALSGLLVSKAQAVFGGTSLVVRSVNAVTPHTPRYAEPSRLYTKLDFDVTVLCDGQVKSGTLTFDIFSELEKALGMSINSDDNELWTVTKTNTGYTVEARRFGHGTGLSQRGAMRMGQLGYRYDQILAFYFEGCRRVQYTFVKSILSALGSGKSETVLTTDTPANVSSEAPCTAVVKMPASTSEMALRVSASSTSDILIGIPHGAAVSVYGKAGSWYLVGYGELVGYAQGEGLVISGTPNGTVPKVTTLKGYGKVKSSDYLNLRVEANTTCDVLAQIPSGTILPLLGIYGDWAKAQYGCQVGYVSLDYVSRSDTYTGKATDADAAGAEVVAVSGTPLYLTPSTSAYEVMNIPSGASVKVKFDDGSWSRVYYAGVTGYVRSDALKMNGTIVEETPDTPAAGEQYAIVASKSSSLNMRESASMSAAVMMEIARGETVIVMKAGSEWCKVRYHGVTGWCATQYLTLGVSGEDMDGGKLTARVTTESGSLNLRRSDSRTSAILTTIPRNTTIVVLDKGMKWSKVTYGGHIGYVMNEFLTFGSQDDLPVIPDIEPDDPSDTPAPPATDMPSSARVTTVEGSLNLRKYARSGATILTTIPQNTVIPVLDIDGTWTKVTYNGKTGFVMSAFLTYIYGESDDTPAPVPPTVPDDTTATYAQVTTESGSLNLRKSANTGAAILRQIPQYEVIPVVSRHGTWTKVTYDGKTGYVMTSFLTFVEVDEGGATTPGGSTGDRLQARVTTESGSLNLRKYAKSGAAILTTIPRNTVIDVLSRGERWSKVTYNGKTGYVMSSFLTFITSSDDNTATPPVTGKDEPYARVTTEEGSLNLRSYASTGARVLDTIPQYDIVAVLEKGAVWTKVSYDGETGYVMTEFLTFIDTLDTPSQPDPEPDPQPPVSQDTLTQLAIPESIRVMTPFGSAVLRGEMNEDGESLAVILSSEYVLMTARGDNWCRVNYEGITGYLPSDVLEFK